VLKNTRNFIVLKSFLLKFLPCSNSAIIRLIIVHLGASCLGQLGIALEAHKAAFGGIFLEEMVAITSYSPKLLEADHHAKEKTCMIERPLGCH
jgi:hypothetical protein